VAVARDGEEAVERAKSFRPDLVLMDVQMPRLDGLAATRRLRDDPAFARTPVVALTALAMPGDEERCREAGADAYLSKPVELKKLIETIAALLARAKLSGEPSGRARPATGDCSGRISAASWEW
jgi:CheY-like chemotaxis protein